MSRFSHPSRGSSQVDLLDLGFDEVSVYLKYL